MSWVIWCQCMELFSKYSGNENTCPHSHCVKEVLLCSVALVTQHLHILTLMRLVENVNVIGLLDEQQAWLLCLTAVHLY